VVISFQFLSIPFYSNAQELPVEIINNFLQYHFNDTLDVTIVNKDSVTYIVIVGLEKYSEYNLWEEITSNILLNRDEIEGNSAPVGLSYYLPPSQSIRINIPINRINIPKVILQDKKCLDKSIAYRLSSTSIEKPQQVISGKLRFSIKIVGDLYQKEYIVIKTDSFIVSK
jgi:hypothetical protein